MFTHKKWDQLCSLLKTRANIPFIKARDACDERGPKHIILKHDVETNLKKALDIAKIEHRYNLPSTFYIQAYLLSNKKNIEILEKIKKLGHEIAYHYDVLDSNKGNWEKSLLEFSKNIKKFKKLGFAIKTICPHGNPVLKRKNWSSNKDFFKNKKIQKKFKKIKDIVINIYDKDNYIYISDTGYKWQIVKDIKNDDKKKIKNQNIKLNKKTFLDLIKKNKSLIISTHPHRWNKCYLKTKIKILIFKILKKTTNFFAKNKFIKKILSNFYYLAKKI
ncbi:hypothetical protein K9K85_01155 [Patescibacteria group bacterium]|nr:hypothetical protein [Patescibacteria group bacterium]